MERMIRILLRQLIGIENEVLKSGRKKSRASIQRPKIFSTLFVRVGVREGIWILREGACSISQFNLVYQHRDHGKLWRFFLRRNSTDQRTPRFSLNVFAAKSDQRKNGRSLFLSNIRHLQIGWLRIVVQTEKIRGKILLSAEERS